MNAQKPRRVAIYARVSTGSQTVQNQLRELRQVAERHGWLGAEEYTDAGISGAKGRDRRPGLDKVLRAVARREVDMVAAWSVDRIGRSLQDLLGFLGELHAKGVDLYLPMLVIHPDECIDCGVCEPECPVEAIKPDTEPGAENWLKLNADYAKTWPNITIKRDPPADSKEWEGKPDKLKYFSPNPGAGD